MTDLDRGSELTIQLSDTGDAEFQSVLAVADMNLWNVEIRRYDGTVVPAQFVGFGREESGDGWETVQYRELNSANQGEPSADEPVLAMPITDIERLVIY